MEMSGNKFKYEFCHRTGNYIKNHFYSVLRIDLFINKVFRLTNSILNST